MLLRAKINVSGGSEEAVTVRIKLDEQNLENEEDCLMEKDFVENERTNLSELCQFGDLVQERNMCLRENEIAILKRTEKSNDKSNVWSYVNWKKK